MAEKGSGTAKELSRQLAVALGYEPDKMLAPRVLAKGRGEVAKVILKVAREAGIPVREDSDLVQVLEKLDIDAEIPPELYKVVAEVLAFVYRMSGEAKPR
jgi:flagellar biosynthesis protein